MELDFKLEDSDMIGQLEALSNCLPNFSTQVELNDIRK